MRTTIGLALLLASASAAAQPSPASSLEARVAALEAEVARLRAELERAESAARGAGGSGSAALAAAGPSGRAAAAAAEPAAAGAERIAALDKRLADVEAREGFRVGGTTFRAGGFVKLWTAYSVFADGNPAPGALVRDFWLPQQVPVGAPRSTHFSAHAKQTRLWLSGTATAGGRPLTGYVEVDFQTAPGTQGTARTTNGYNLAMRRAYATWGGFLAGQDWTTFQNVGALPETTDFIGPTEGTIFVRQPLIRWTTALGRRASLALAAENPITSSITSASPALAESDDAAFPDLVMRVSGKIGRAELSLAGLAHDVTVYDGREKDSSFGWGLSLAGRVPFGPAGRHDLRFMLTGGEGIGHYVGLNFAPDAVFTNGRVHAVGLVSGFAALRLGWTSSLRSTVMGSFQEVDWPRVPLPATANDSAWSAAANLFLTPVRGLDLGLEFRHGERKIISGETGTLDRLEFVTRYTF